MPDNIIGGNVNIGGTQDFHGAVTIIMHDVTNTINASSVPPDEKAALQKLVSDMENALKQEGSKNPDGAEEIAKRTKEAVEEAISKKPNRGAIEAKANLLKEAAQNVAGAMPIVVGIATNIVIAVLKMGTGQP